MKKVAIYARISTSDKKQDLETQLLPLREICKKRGWQIVCEYCDIGSGSVENREKLSELKKQAFCGKFDIVLVFRFDRFARSTKQLVNALEEFKSQNIDFVSYCENVDTTTPAGKVLFTMISAFAEFERSIIQERVRAGLDRARAKGKILGRPKAKTLKKEVEIMNNLKLGYSIRKTALYLGVSVAHVMNVKLKHKKIVYDVIEC